MGTGRQYDEEFKKQAIKLGKEVGIKAAAEQTKRTSYKMETKAEKV